MSVVLVTPSGVCVPVLISEPWYWLPVLVIPPEVFPPPRLLLLRFGEELLDAELRLAELFDAPLLAPPRLLELLPPPDAEPPLLATLVLVLLLAEANPLEEEPPRLADEPPLLEVLRPPPELLEAVLEPPRLADGRLEEELLDAELRLAELFDAPLLAPPRLLELLPPPLLEDEPPRLDEDLDAPFLDAPFDEDLPPPEDLLPPFFAAAFLVDFAIVDRI